jgi:multidrug efflux system membrane fusion protein
MPTYTATLAGTALLLLAAACSPTPEAASGAPAPLPVRVAMGEPVTLAPPVEATGVLGALDHIALSFSLPGVVLRVQADAGDPVRQGDLLATLDLREADARVRQAAERVQMAERTLARLERLVEDRVVPRVQVEDAGTELEVARAALAEAQVSREFAEIRAPADGVVLERHVEVGERVQPGSPVFLVGRGGSQRIRAHLSDRDRVRVALGERAEFLPAALPDAAHGGRITQLGGTADRISGGFPVEVTLEEPLSLPSGVVGRLRILPASGITALRIPTGALLEGEGTEGRVLVLDAEGATVLLRSVTLGGMDESGILVTGGLAPTDRVVVEGGAWLTQGDRVQVIR